MNICFMKRIIILICVSIALCFTMESCFTTKTYVGERGTSYKEYSRGKQWFLFWGLIPVGNPNTPTPSDGKCMVSSKNNFVDMIITGFTGGIVSTRTVIVKQPTSNIVVPVKQNSQEVTQPQEETIY